MRLLQLFHAAGIAACALALLGAAPSRAQDCLPPACAASESADGGVPDGHFESPPAAPAEAHAETAVTRSETADEPGAAIFNPFAGAQAQRNSVQVSPLARLFSGGLALPLAIAVLLLLAGIAVFGYLRLRRPL